MKTGTDANRDLVISRLIDAPPALAWTAWTRPEHLKQCWAPAPLTTPEYTARALHKNAADREKHEQIGFHEGWGRCLDQLAGVVARLRR